MPTTMTCDASSGPHGRTSASGSPWASPYPNRTFERIFKTFGSHLQAYALCVDPDGAMTSINRGFEVSIFPSGNGFPVILDTSASPDEGEALPGLDVEFEVVAHDPDGDSIECRVDFGHEQGSEMIAIPAARQGSPVPAVHTYTSRGSYGASIVCDDGSARGRSRVRMGSHLRERQAIPDCFDRCRSESAAGDFNP